MKKMELNTMFKESSSLSVSNQSQPLPHVMRQSSRQTTARECDKVRYCPLYSVYNHIILSLTNETINGISLNSSSVLTSENRSIKRG